MEISASIVVQVSNLNKKDSDQILSYNKAYYRNYYLEHRDKIIEQAKRHYYRNKESKKEYYKEYYLENRESIRGKMNEEYYKKRQHQYYIRSKQKQKIV